MATNDYCSEYWMVWFYNPIDAEFGFDPGATAYMNGLEPAVAKSIARHMNKVDRVCSYWAEEEPRRWW